VDNGRGSGFRPFRVRDVNNSCKKVCCGERKSSADIFKIIVTGITEITETLRMKR